MNNAHEARIAYLDAVRAIAACLGIVLHTAAGYMKYPSPQWPRFCEKYNIIFDCIAISIHSFRMPVFFFLAGFFSYWLLRKYCLAGFIHNRVKRIALPFVIISLLLHLPVLLDKIIKQQIHSLGDLLLPFQNVSYLWFLEYLLIYYLFLSVIILFFRHAKKFTNQDWWTHLSNVRWLQPKLLYLIIPIFSFIFLYKGHMWFTPTILRLKPDIWLLGFYALYFVLGYIIAHTNEHERFFTFKMSNFILGTVIYSVYLYLLNFNHHETTKVWAEVLFAFSNFFLFLSFMSLCFTFLYKKNLVLQLISKASYFMYLSQIFFIMMLYQMTAKLLISIYTQFALICGLTLLLTIATHFLLQRLRAPSRAPYPLS
jgi:glucans biosynthesis protein C